MDSQIDFLESLHRFGKNKIDPTAMEDDEREIFRMEIYQGLGEMGLTGLLMPENLGGLEQNFSVYLKCLEKIAYFNVSYAVTLSVSTMVQSIINQAGSVDQKKKYLPPLISGEQIGAFGLTESQSGSDASALKTKATKVEGGYLLNGSKMFITSGGLAETYIVWARTEPLEQSRPGKGISAFILEKGFKGFSFGKKEKKMGWKVSPTTELIFHECFVPDKNVLGTIHEGFKLALSGLDKGRLAIGAISLGLSQRAFDEALQYSFGRKQFQQRIFDFQATQFLFSDLNMEIESSRCLIEKSAQFIDEGKINSRYCSLAKIKASDTAMRVTTDAVQIFGGVGYTAEYPVERLMRDAKALQIVEGTNQIQRSLVAKYLKQEFDPS